VNELTDSYYRCRRDVHFLDSFYESFLSKSPAVACQDQAHVFENVVGHAKSRKPAATNAKSHRIGAMRTAVAMWLVCGVVAFPAIGGAAERDELKRDFQDVVSPFLKTYCTDCHGGDKPEAKFDLSLYTSLDSVANDLGHWETVRERLRGKEMPPEEATTFPDDELRRRIVQWIERLRHDEAARNAGDPGPVLARRLSNAEYDYSIHDLTGIDIRPTREFPVDPANQAGFDNSGESLNMSPALLNKYLAAARHVTDHLVFLPDGLDFAPHPVVVYSDRDKFCVHRIVDFYQQQPTDYADYFVAAWRFRHRAQLGTPDTTLDEVAKAEGVSGKYLTTLWTLLTDTEDNAGPIAKLREQWNRLPLPDGDAEKTPDTVRAACERLRELVVVTRKEFNLPEGNFAVKALNPSAQPIILWKDREIAAHRRLGKLPEPDGAPETEQLRSAAARFCRVFPDTFFVSERGRMFLPPGQREKGRLLNAGFHLMVGYFRDDAPLYDLILDRPQQQKLDDMWHELDFVTQAPIRQFVDFVYFEREEDPGFLSADEFAFARADADATSESKMKRLAPLYLAKARTAGVDEKALQVIDAYFADMSANIRRLEKERADAEPSHVDALLSLAERGWQRPLTESDRDDLVGFYRSLKEQEGLSHEDAVRDTLVSVLMSPRFCYRITVAEPGNDAKPLSDYELASRLSFFLWSSIPDSKLRQHAAAGDLHDPEVLLAEMRRMLQDSRASRLATEFGGNWLDFRRFETHNGVNRDRFSEFTDELRHAMYEEPIRFFTDLIQRDGSVLEFLEADHTFVNPVLAEHYGIPFPSGDSNEWIRIDDASRYGRGGLLPMSVFLTQNSPGLRTSPVKRGYWIVRRLLGERIPPPPPEVPKLPEDESTLGDLSLRDLLAKHRESKSCAACHSKFDSLGLAFEGYGPVGELREVDLGGRAVDSKVKFPDGSEGEGLAGLKRYVNEARQAEFIDNLCRKLLSYALGRSLILPDEITISQMKERLAANDYRFSSIMETIVTSPQFLRKRGRDYAPLSVGTH